ncbi:MAG: hypothetical protein ACRDUA_04300 [Micromonosporaceae bacterium]
MPRITVSLDDATVAAVKRAASGGSVSKWVAGLIHQTLYHQASAAAAAYDQKHDDPDHEAHRLAGAA